MNRNRGRKGEEEREPLRIAKDFNFQIAEIYFIFKLNIWVTSTTTANFESIRQLQNWVNKIFYKIGKPFNSSDV